MQDEPPFTYPEVGATAAALTGVGGLAGAQRALPAGYHRFLLRRRIGYGRDLFELATEQILTYRMQRGAGVFHTAETPKATPGAQLTVKLGPRILGITVFGRPAVLAPCRVVYTLHPGEDTTEVSALPGIPDTSGTSKPAETLLRGGFAYGTLPGHPERGEELFAVEYDPADHAVYGLILAFSRNAAWYARLGGPAVRLIQRYVTGKYLDALPTNS